MAEKIINIFLTTFTGLELPRTLSIPVPSSTPICDLRSKVLSRLPALDVGFNVHTYPRKELLASISEPVSSLLPNKKDDILPLWISVPLRGGKGGFGSQLRAAGGRMASRKKRNQGENNGSSRNLDGRRLRTVTEAKALAEYLAVKPEMEQKEKDSRRQRWLGVVGMAEKRDEEIRNGGKGKVDGRWVEDKEEAAERTRETVAAVMQKGIYNDTLPSLTRSFPDTSIEPKKAPGDLSIQREQVEDIRGPSSGDSSPKSAGGATVTARGATLQCFGFDEDEFISEDGSSETGIEEE